MSTHVISRRIQFLIQYINDSYFPSKLKLLEFLTDKDFTISSRTFDRDLERIRTDFGLEILYDKDKNGYYINQETSVKVASFFKFIELVAITDIFSDSLKDSKKMLEYVSFDDSKTFKGIDHLKPILIAIQQQRYLRFIHENFLLKTLKSYTITPFLLKEYENRWYVIGVPKGTKSIRTFGIDRITELSIGEFSERTKDEYEDALKVFDAIIGLDYEDQQPIKIRILVSEPQINYLRSLPIHHSQFIHPTAVNEQHYVDFFLVPNYEFKAQILKMGAAAVIISPSELKAELKNTLTTMLNNYI